MTRDPETLAHLEWIGFVQPVGLLVSIPALLNAEAYVNKNIAPVHHKFLSCLAKDDRDQPLPKLTNFKEFAHTVLGWEPEDILDLAAAHNSLASQALEILLPEYQDCLKPTFAIPELKPREGQSPWIMLIQVLENSISLDDNVAHSTHGWHASPHARFERLLRETEVPVGILANSEQIRIVYAPRGENSGYATFELRDMIPVAGRPILAALHMLLSVDRLFLLQEKRRLPALLAESRKYQNTVSNKLAAQVLAALYELLRGFQAANEQLKGELLKKVLAENANHVYAGLLNVLMRLVFILYAEDRGLLSASSVYTEYYSVSRLFERLREDAGRYPETMDQRYGAWAQLLTLFRLIFEGGSHDNFNIPARKGHLFDPDLYLFLEGRDFPDSEFRVPHVSDGVIFRLLSNLLLLDGERLSYRTLDVEQIGSVYEAVMGFALHLSSGPSIAIKAKKTLGAPTTINLQTLLDIKPADRTKWLTECTGLDLTGTTTAQALRNAKTIEDILLVLEKRIARNATPYVVPRGNMILQPSDERRRSGSHYTPRSLTEPIVRTALRPVIDALGASPTPEQILSIKVCDPAMGSGAFLVEACRQLGHELVKSWTVHQRTPIIPPDEDELLHARRLVAQRCLYGVDKNPMAVNLAKLSLWLATLAKDHPFTFMDHTLRYGDSLVGLTREQIMRFHWKVDSNRVIDEGRIKACIKQATQYRREILESAESTLYPILATKLQDADKALEIVRTIGDYIVSAYFSSDKDRLRLAKRDENLTSVSNMLDGSRAERARSTEDDQTAIVAGSSRLQNDIIKSFHWQIEFPEVFDRDNGGFDCIVGNPPFMGGSKLSTSMGKTYLAWLASMHEEAKGKSDLVAYFFRRAFELLRNKGAFGLVATNSIAQGDTRHTGLRWIREHQGVIYFADRRRRWPGIAAVVVSVVHVFKGLYQGQCFLDGRETDQITAYLIHFGPDDNPHSLVSNRELVHSGTNINGKGFVLSPREREQLIDKDKRNGERIRPYLGAVEMNESPTSEYTRFVIYMEGLTVDQVETYPDLYNHLYSTVRVQRQSSSEQRLREQWWTYSRPARSLYTAASLKTQVLASGRAGGHICFVFQPIDTIFSDSLTLFLFEDFKGFCILQSRVHEVWARLMGSSLKDDLRYIPEDCFETFPFPPAFAGAESIARIGEQYYEARSRMMLEHQEGLTSTYNRFHDPSETSSDIMRLRQLHEEMDRAVLDCYGWNDVPCSSEFIVDYADSDDDDNGDEDTSSAREPWRYRWPNQIRDEVLVRLLELNKQRFKEECLAGLSSIPSRKKSSKNKRTLPTKKSAALVTKEENQDQQLSLLHIDS